MVLYGLDKTFTPVAAIYDHDSIIWDERFNTTGEFQLVLKVDDPVITALQQNFYLSRTHPLHSEYLNLMVIEEFSYPNNDDTIIKINGRDFKSILDRRCIISKDPFAALRTAGDETEFSLESAVQAVLEDSFIQKVGEADPRKIDSFRFISGTSIKAKTTKAAFSANHDNVYNWIEKACQAYSVGFSVQLHQSQNGSTIECSLLDQVDRTSELIFAKEYGNLSDDSYLESSKKYKNTLITGEDGSYRTYQSSKFYGLDRKEIYVDFDENTMSDEKKFQDSSKRELASYITECTFDGQINSDLYVYNEQRIGKVSYKLGDVAIVVSRRKYAIQAYVSEYIYSEENGEIKEYPSFTYLPETASYILGQESTPEPTPIQYQLLPPIATRDGVIYTVEAHDTKRGNFLIANQISLYINDGWKAYIKLPKEPADRNGSVFILNTGLPNTIDWSKYSLRSYASMANRKIVGTYYNGSVPVNFEYEIASVEIKGFHSPFSLHVNLGSLSFGWIYYDSENDLVINIDSVEYKITEASGVLDIEPDQEYRGYAPIDDNLVKVLLELGDLIGRPVELDLTDYVKNVSEIRSAYIKSHASGFADSEKVILPTGPITWEYPVKMGSILKITQAKEINNEEEGVLKLG